MSTTTRTALLVEDDPSLLEVLHDTLVDAGFETLSVTAGQPAIDALAQRCFDVLIIDVSLPDMNGLAICEAARRRYQNRVAILVITGHHIRDRMLASLELCADDFMAKPVHLGEFIARIESKLRYLS